MYTTIVILLLYGSSLMIKYGRKCHLPTLTPGKREGNFIRNRDNKLRKRGEDRGEIRGRDNVRKTSESH